MAESGNIKIFVSDFSQSPGPRYINQGDSSGEEFYLTVLNKEFAEAIKLNRKLSVNLDGVDGYMSSFLDEAFGNLVYDFGLDKVEQLLDFISTEEPEWIKMIKEDTFPEWERRRKKNEKPKKTSPHNSWYRLIGNEIIECNSVI